MMISRFQTAGMKAHGLPVCEQCFQILLEKSLVVQTTVPALAPIGEALKKLAMGQKLSGDTHNQGMSM